MIAHLQRLLQWPADETPEAKLDKLEQALQRLACPCPRWCRCLAALLSLPLPERYPPLTLTPQRQRQKTQEALLAWLLAEAERQPVLAVWKTCTGPIPRRWSSSACSSTRRPRPACSPC